jgi:hypothetical protein
MSRESENITIWTCDACGHRVERKDIAFPPGWRVLVHGNRTEALGNKPAKDLCSTCATLLDALMAGRPLVPGPAREKESTS